MKLSRIGVDLAKNVYQLHGVDRSGSVACDAASGGVEAEDFPLESGRRDAGEKRAARRLGR